MLKCEKQVKEMPDSFLAKIVKELHELDAIGVYQDKSLFRDLCVIQAKELNLAHSVVQELCKKIVYKEVSIRFIKSIGI